MANTRDYGKMSGPRRKFASGGSVYPIQGATGSARWMGAGPENYAAMRAEMSPSDFATFRQNVSPEEYNTFMGTSTPTPAAAATPAADTPAPTYPTAQATPLPARPAFNPQTLTPGVAKAPIAPQAQENVQPYVKSGPVV